MSGTAWTLAVLAGTVLAADRLARTSCGRLHDLLPPGILAGSLGNALGTYLGFLVVGLLD